MEKSVNWTVSLRPKTLNEVYGLEHIKKYAYNAAKNNAWPNVLYLQGQYGSGKTTTAKIIAQMMACKNPKENGDPCCECNSCKAIIEEKWNRDVIRKNCRDMGGVDGLRETLRDFTATPPFMDKRKVLILDELQEFADSGKAAVDTLLTYTESPSPNIRFIFTSMLDTVKESNSTAVKTAFKALGSRSTTFKIPYANYNDLMKFMMESLTRLGKVPEKLDQKFLEAMSVIAQNSDGSYRTALQTLQQCFDADIFDKEKILEEMDLIDTVSEMELLISILNGDASQKVFDTILSTKDYNQQFNFLMKAISDAECYRLFKEIPNGLDFLKKQASIISSHKNFPILRDGFKKIIDDCNGFLKNSNYILGICHIIEECKKASIIKKVETPAPVVNQPIQQSTVQSHPQIQPITQSQMQTQANAQQIYAQMPASDILAQRRAARAARLGLTQK